MGEVPFKTTELPLHVIVGGLGLVKAFTVDLSLNKAHSAPVSAAKKASLVSLAEVPNFISLSEIFIILNVIAKMTLEITITKSKTNPLFFLFSLFAF